MDEESLIRKLEQLQERQFTQFECEVPRQDRIKIILDADKAIRALLIAIHKAHRLIQS